MRAVIQRVASASVEVDGKTISSIGRGLLVLVGVAPGDGAASGQCSAKAAKRLSTSSQKRTPPRAQSAKGAAIQIATDTS
jgi:D-Tyr-tRNAtyr deacylase